jgi:hypothetical protein
MAIKMSDRRFMAPGDLVACQTENAGDLIALGRAWRPSALQDRLNAPGIETGLTRESLVREMVFGTKLVDGFACVHRSSFE